MRGQLTGATHEGYARLPEDLLNDLLDGTPALVAEVESLLGANLDSLEELRAALVDLGLVRKLCHRELGSIAGVDGGFGIERTSSVDISLAVAVGVEGLSDTTTYWESTQHEWWARVARHDLEGERLCRGVMVAQELAVLRNAPHTYRILDGSHLTPVIQLNSALTVHSDELRVEAARVWERLETTDALSELVTNQRILAMPKYDSSRVIAGYLAEQVGFEVAGDDKFLMSLLLEAEEYLAPQQVERQPWEQLHFDSPSLEHKHIAEQFEESISPLKKRELSFTYFKPDELSPAFRIEAKRSMPNDTLESLLTTLLSQMTGPFVREPYPQYLADVMAKSVGLGLSALHASVQLSLSQSDRPNLAGLLLSSYRTEGV